MIYLDAAATTLQKPDTVRLAVLRAMQRCASVGRGGHPPAMEAAESVYRCRQIAAELFGAEAEQVGAGSGGGTGFVRAELLRHRTAAPQRRVGHPRRILRLEILRQNRRLLRKKIDQLTES